MATTYDLGRGPICWTRMQAEAGEQLARIMRRKELERRSGDGIFFWGVGSAPSRAIPKLVRTATAIDVLFSVMKSKPKAKDAAPAKVVAWRSYVDIDGVVRPIPDHVLVTSRASSRGYHYALICRSDTPLGVSDEGPFDPAAFRNVGAGGAVGASQVTALLERRANDGVSDYRVAMRARLTDGFWVKLIDPIDLDDTDREALEADPVDEDEWLALVTGIRSKGGRAARSSSQPTLFSV